MSADESGDEEPGNNSSTQPERKGSIVTATTISQTIESSRRQPAVLLKSSLFLEGEEEEDPDMTERLEALGDPPHARGLLLLAEMSSEGSLLTGEYTLRCVEAAQKNRDFVLGFVSQRTLNGMADNFLSLTPGVKLPPEGEVNGQTHEGDRLGQQYRTPEKVIYGDGCDIIIVGRGILGAKNRAIEAERYRAAAWKAYESRIR
jgi:uridine monophosphate synthetase